MSYLKKNMLAFSERVLDFSFPKDDDYEKDNYIVETSKTGVPTLKYQGESSTVYVHSKYDPEKDGENFAKNYRNKIEATNVLVHVGLGLGYEARAFLKYMNPGNLLIIYEPNWHIFRLTMENLDMTDILKDKRVAFIFGTNRQYIPNYLSSFISLNNYQNILYTVKPFYERKYIEDYKFFTETLLETVKKARILSDTFSGWGKIWTETVIRNIPHFTESTKYNDFMNTFPSRPIVVVAAGPSLDKNIHLLKEIKNRIPIVCVYTAYKALKKYSIEPDFIITLDSSQTIHESDKDKEEVFDVPLAYLCISNTQLIDRFKNGKIYCQSEHSAILKKILPEKFYGTATIFVGGSVTISALHFAYYLGGNPVITIGFDLALEGNQSHATGTVYAENQNLTQRQLVKENVFIDGINGGKVNSSYLFENYLRSAETFIKAHPEITFIDATEGGALIKGTEIDTFSNTIEKHIDGLESNVDDLVKNKFESSEFITPEDVIEISKNLHDSKEQVEKICEYAKEGKELSQKVLDLFMYGKPSKEITRPIIKRYSELDVMMNKIMEDLPLFNNAIERVNFVLKSHQPYHEENEQIYFARHSLILYNEVIDIGERITGAINEVIEKINLTDCE